MNDAFSEEKARRADEETSDYPAHIMPFIAEWLCDQLGGTRRPLLDWIDLPVEELTPLELAEKMLGESEAGMELLERFKRDGGQLWDTAHQTIIDDISDDDVRDAVEEDQRYAAEVAETEASLMPGRV